MWQATEGHGGLRFGLLASIFNENLVGKSR